MTAHGVRLATLVLCFLSSGEHLLAQTDEQTKKNSPVTRSNAQLARPTFRPYGRIQVLSIGVNKYFPLSDYSDLELAEADAAAVATTLQTNFGYTVERLIGAKATKTNIDETLKRYQTQLGQDDILIVFFAGHGDSAGTDTDLRGFLIPYGARLKSTSKTAIASWQAEALEMQQFAAALTQMKCRHVLMIVDACYSGFFGSRSGGGSSGRFDLDILLSGRSRLVLTAGIKGQSSIEGGVKPDGTKFTNSWFTTALLKHLQSKTAFSARELALDVRRDVLTFSRGAMQPQLREVAPELYGEFVFVPTGSAATLNDSSYLDRFIGWFRSRGQLATSVKDIYDAITADNYRFGVNAQKERERWQNNLKRFEATATLGDPLAMAALSIAYAKGLGTEKNPAEARRWALESYYSDHHPAGAYALAKCYREGLGGSPNVLLADRLLEESRQQRFAPAITDSAVTVLNKRGSSPENIRDAIQALESIKADFPLAGVQLGRYYLYPPHNSPVNADQAAALLTKAAEDGLSEARSLLFNLYYTGRPGFPKKDEGLAARWVRAAAEQGHPGAQARLATLYRTGAPGAGIRKDVAEAIKWADSAASQDSEPAHTILYEIFVSETPSFDRARTHLEAAVKLRSRIAIYHQASEYGKGRLYSKDMERSAKLLTEAARLGYPLAEADLGTMFHQCNGFFTCRTMGCSVRAEDSYCAALQPKHQHADLDAIYWYLRGARQGSATAQHNGRAVLSDWNESDRQKLPSDLRQLFPDMIVTIEEIKRLFQLR